MVAAGRWRTSFRVRPALVLSGSLNGGIFCRRKDSLVPRLLTTLRPWRDPFIPSNSEPARDSRDCVHFGTGQHQRLD